MNHKDRLKELEFLTWTIKSSKAPDKAKENMLKTIIPVYRREYITDIAMYKKGEQDRLREDFDTLFVIPEIKK